MALTAITVNDSDTPFPYMLPKAVPASLAVSVTAALGFLFTLVRPAQTAPNVAQEPTPVFVQIVGDAAWTYCHLDQANQVPVAANQPIGFVLGISPVSIYARSAAGANIFATVIGRANPASTY